MSKINFTKEHQGSLEKLFTELSFAGETLQGKFGAGIISPYDALHNLSMASLKSVNTQLKNEIAAKEKDTDEWTNTEYDQQQLKLKKKWQEFIHLMIGYKRSEEEKARNSKELRELKRDLAELEASNKTPEQKINELKAKINSMEGGPEEPAATPTA